MHLAEGNFNVTVGDLAVDSVCMVFTVLHTFLPVDA